MTNAKRLSSGASFLDSLTRLASRLRSYLPFRSNAMAESYKPLFEDARFNGGRSSADAVEHFELLAGGLMEGNDRLVDLVPTYIEIRKELKHPWHEYILAEVTLRNPTAGTHHPLGLLMMERSFLDHHYANDPDQRDASSDPPRTTAEPAPANAGGSTTTTAPPRATSVPAAVATTVDHGSTHSHPPDSATAEPAPANAGGSTTATAPPRATSAPAAVAKTVDHGSTHSHPPDSASAEPAPANAGGSTTTTAPPRVTSAPEAVATTVDHASTHSHPPDSATANTTAAGNHAQKKDSFWKSGSASDLASESSYRLSHSAQAISTSAYDKIRFLPMSELKTLNDKSLPVLEMRLNNTSPATLAAIPDYAILHLLILTDEYTKNHTKYSVLNHQCYHFAIHAFRCAQLLINSKEIYQEKSFTYTGDRSHIKRGYYWIGASFRFTGDPGLNHSTVRMLTAKTEQQVKVQLEVWLKRGNLKGERTKRQEAEAAAEEERKQKEEAKRAAEEERKQKEEAKRAAEEAERAMEEAQRAAEKERKQKEEAQRAAEEERKKREALEEHLARLMGGYALTEMVTPQHK
ncbi:hypothetical protein K474DRAFT_1665084 [Panus rudis PR-1116 ss-1]|nr:hypothetical protein K474DRAFT_1665084 [Panus rudis PR-1116 ss-1]